MRIAALLFVLMVAAGCGGGENSSSPADGSETRTAIDETAKVRYELRGAHLRVEVLSDAPRFEDLFLGRGAFTFGCGTDRYGTVDEPAAEGSASFSPQTRTAEVELSADVSEDVIVCHAIAPGGAVERTGKRSTCRFTPSCTSFPKTAARAPRSASARTRTSASASDMRSN